MIVIKSGDKQIYNPKNPNLKLISPKLILEDNAAGSLTFKIYESNLNYNAIEKLYPVISVIRNNETIFKGRVIADKKDFYNGKDVEVEGKLAFFNDSYLEPFSFSGSPEELFRMIIENHNSQVKDWQQFNVGVVTVEDSNDYIVRSSENVLNTWEALKSRCFQSSLGGHIRIRYEKDGDFIDWLSDYETISSQNIEFAKNMLDLSLNVDATETYTAIRPIGAEVDGRKVDISSVNDGKLYLVNEEKAEKYGIIYAPVNESTWEDVTLPANLLRKAEEKLYGTFAMLNEAYEIRAVDLNLTDESIEALNICEYVLVKSRMHGIEARYLLNKAEVFIAEPQNSVYHLGAVKRTFDDANNSKPSADVSIPKDVSAFRNDANYVSEAQAEALLEEYTKEDDVKNIVTQYVEELSSGKDGADGIDGLSAYEIAVKNGFEGTEAEWIASLRGEPGKDGERGEKGEPGSPGKDGADGISPKIRIGTVATGAPGTNASVTNSGTSTNVILNFTIPRGDKGAVGDGSAENMIEIISSTYDSVNNQFTYYNQKGVYSPLLVETNSYWNEVKDFVSVEISINFQAITKVIQEG